MSRYIDAKEVEKRIDVVIGSEPKAWDKKALKELKMYIVHAIPTADVRENVKGEWITTYLDHVAMGERPKILYCSVCNQCIAYPTNYCPNCGADMRGEDNGRDEENHNRV